MEAQSAAPRAGREQLAHTLLVADALAPRERVAVGDCETPKRVLVVVIVPVGVPVALAVVLGVRVPLGDCDVVVLSVPLLLPLLDGDAPDDNAAVGDALRLLLKLGVLDGVVVAGRIEPGWRWITGMATDWWPQRPL